MRSLERLFDNHMYVDPTASIALSNVSLRERLEARRQRRYSRIPKANGAEPLGLYFKIMDFETPAKPAELATNPIIIYPAEQDIQPMSKNKSPETELRLQLEDLGKQKREGLISPSEYRKSQGELAGRLHEAMRKAGHKPIRTKTNIA